MAVKLAPSTYSQVLEPYVDALQVHTSANATHTWSMTITPSYESWWANMIAVAKSGRVETRADAIRALYGQRSTANYTLPCLWQARHIARFIPATSHG